MRVWLLTTLLLVAIAATTNAAAQSNATVVLIHTADEPAHEPLWQLQLAVEAHFSSLPVVVTTAAYEGEAITVGVAREILEQQGALSAAWLAADRETFHTFTPSLGDRSHPHELPAAGEAWASRCEVFASAWLPELEPLLRAPVEPDQPDELDDLDVEPVPPELPSRVGPRGVVSLAYLPMPVDGPLIYRSGVSLGGGVRLGGRVEVAFEFNAMQPIPLGVSGSDARLARYPLRLGAAALWPVGRLELGFVAAFVLELWQVQALGYATEDEAATRLHADPAASLAFRARLPVLPGLAFYADAGGDLFFGADPFTLDGGSLTLFERKVLQPRLAVGAAFSWGVNRR